MTKENKNAIYGTIYVCDPMSAAYYSNKGKKNLMEKRVSMVETIKKKPLLTCVITDNTTRKCIATIRNAIYDGADAFYLDYSKLDDEDRTVSSLKKIFDYCEDKPVMVMCYRRKLRPDMTDEKIADGLLRSIEAGASIVDVLGDLYNQSPLQLSKDPESFEKQKKLVERIHSMGGEVMMSSHTWIPMTSKQTLEHARELLSRGADMIKIACTASSEEEVTMAFHSTLKLKNEFNAPFLHVCMGQYGKLHRVISPMIGSSMALCVQSYNDVGMYDQVLLKATKAVFDNLDWRTARDTSYGTIHECCGN